MEPLPPEVIAELNRINSLPIAERLPALQALVDSVDVTAPAGSTGLLWSGEFRVSAGGRPFRADSLAALVGQGNPQLAMVQNTPLGQMLLSTEFREALRAAVNGDATRFDDLLGGVGVAGHAPSSFWGQASQRFVASLSGPVATLVGNSDPGRIFGRIELQAALDNPNITSIAGIPADDLRGLNNLDEAFVLVTARSLANNLDIHIGWGDLYDTDGTPLADDNGPIRGTFGRVSAEWGTNNDISAYNEVDTTRGRIADGSTEAGARRIGILVRETPGVVGALRRLTAMGGRAVPVAGTALMVTFAIAGTAQALELYSAGDRRGAGLVLGRTYGNIVGSEIAGYGAMVIAAPLLAAGPPGWLGYGAIVVGASIIGGEVGETLGEIMAADRVWIDPINPGPRSESVWVNLNDLFPAYSGPDTIDYNLFDLPPGFAVQDGRVIDTATGLEAFVTTPVDVVDGVERIAFNEHGRVTPGFVIVARAGNIIRIDMPIDPISGERTPTTIVIRTDGSHDPEDVVAGVMSAVREGGGSEEQLGIVDSSLSSPEQAEAIIQEIMRREGILEITLEELDEDVPIWVAPTIRGHVLSLEGIARDLGGAFRLDASDLMGAVGQVLGRHLAGDNPFAQVALSSALESVLTSLGTYLEGRGAPTGAEPAGEGLGDVVEAGLSGDFLATLGGQAIGAISSYLVGELYESLGLEGDLAEFNASIDSRVIAQIAYNLANPVWVDAAGEAVAAGTPGATNARGWADGLNTQFFAMAAASWIGTRLAHEIYEFETIGGQIGAAAGSIYGYYNASAAYAALLKAGMSNVYAFVIAVVIIVIDTLLGGYIGSAISGNAKAGAAAGWDERDQRFTVNGVWSKNGGSKDAVRAMAGYVADLLNNVVSASGSRVIDGAGVQSGAYDQKNRRFIYKANAARTCSGPKSISSTAPPSASNANSTPMKPARSGANASKTAPSFAPSSSNA